MTDTDITKALECCKGGFCCGCPRLSNNMVTVDCMRELINDTFDLINRQQSAIDVYMQENDRLKTAYIQVSMDRDEAKAEIERLQIRLRKERHQFEDLGRMYSEIRAEAIKEFVNEFEYAVLHKEFWNEHPHTSQVWLNGYEQCMRDMRVMLKDKLN